MADAYATFAALRSTEPDAFRITAATDGRAQEYAIIAPHGGGIEPGTSEVARAIAGQDHTFYLFEGVLPNGNARLHITSSNFDEPQALALVGQCQTVVAVHGCIDGRGAETLLGGLDADRRDIIARALAGAGFPTALAPSGLRATDPRNICNRGMSGAGVQLELARRLRNSLIADAAQRALYAAAVRAALRDD